MTMTISRLLVVEREFVFNRATRPVFTGTIYMRGRRELFQFFQPPDEFFHGNGHRIHFRKYVADKRLPPLFEVGLNAFLFIQILTDKRIHVVCAVAPAYRPTFPALL